MRKFLRNIPIRGKLMMSYLFLLTFALSIPAVITFRTVSSTIKEQVEHNVQETLDQAHERFTSHMIDVESILFNIKADSRIHQILNWTQQQDEVSAFREIDEIETRLLNADRYKRKTTNITLYADNKEMYSYINRYGYSDVFSAKDFENIPWYRNTLEKNGGIYWQYNREDSNAYRQMISASIAIKDFSYNGRILGVTKASIDMLYFLDDMNDIRFGDTGRVLLVCDGNLIGDKNIPLINSLDSDLTFFETIYSSPDGSTYKKLKNGEHLVAYKKIDNTNWKLVAVVPTRELLKKVNIIGTSILVTSILCLAIAFILSLLISHRISKPITHLAKVMKVFDTDLNIRIDTKGSGEVGFLIRSFNNMAGKINLLIKDIEEISRKEKNAELKALESQINPHFLYNTLDSINWMSLKYNDPDISYMITSLAKFLRYSLNKGKELISVENELEQVQSYINIQQTRYKGKFEVNIKVDKELYSCRIIKLVLQPLVENSIIHGFKDIDYQGEITIEGYKKDGFIYLEVIDNGIGADIDRLNEMLSEESGHESSENNSYGIRNVNDRLKLHYGETCGLSFEESSYGGVKAIVKCQIDINAGQQN